MIRSHALTVFVTLLGVLLSALVCDLIQSLAGHPTISQFCWDQPAIGVVPVLVLIGLVGALAVHLWGPTDPPPDPPW